MPITNIQPCSKSRLAVMLCSQATGQLSYASRCTARHTRLLRWRRSRLVTTTATVMSRLTAPSPTQIGPYGDASGTTTAVSGMFT